MDKFLSIIIPAYNCKAYLTECVESVLNINCFCEDTFYNELILVDDGSTDGSSELCDELAGKSGNTNFEIRVIHQQNTGVSAARNAGLKAAEGKYILFIDSDDTVDAEKLAELLNVVAEDSTIDMAVFGLTFDYYNKGNLYRRDPVVPHIEGKKSLEECRQILYELYADNCLSAIWNKIIKKSVIEKNNVMLREEMFSYEDLEYSLRVLSNCTEVYFSSKIIYHYRQAEKGFECRRLARIPHLFELIDLIAEAIDTFGKTDAKEKILLNLYSILMADKIAYSSKDEISRICYDYKWWVDEHGLLNVIEGRGYAMLIYNGQVSKIMARREYSKIRHSVANWLKQNIGDFRKW